MRFFDTQAVKPNTESTSPSDKHPRPPVLGQHTEGGEQGVERRGEERRGREGEERRGKKRKKWEEEVRKEGWR